MVDVADVRSFLKEIPQQYVTDDTILTQIHIAEFIVKKEKSAAATEKDVETAVLLIAAHLTLCAYASEVERSLGVVSPSLNALIDRLKMYADKALQYVKRGYTVKAPEIEISDSLLDYVRGVNL